MIFRKEIVDILCNKFGSEEGRKILEYIEAITQEKVATQKDIYELKLKVQLEQKVIERTKELYEKTKKLELQMQIKTVLTNVIPSLVASAPAANRNMFIKEMCNQVEVVLWNKYLSKFKEIDRNILGNGLCKIMNELGGKFEVHKILDKKLFIKGIISEY
ncbi:MAG TPA: hypothetical protein EYP22_01345 [Methanosarcinales archaeon]|nr:hypothetical protein [Methanosarcinales archaeon]